MADAPKYVPLGRRKLLINKKFQLSFLTYLVVSALSVVVIFYAANWAFFYKFETLGRTAGLPPDHVFFLFLRDQARTMNVIFAVTSVVTVLFHVSVGLVLSHRVAGPLLRLRNHLTKIAEGAPDSPVNFRKKDYFQELPEAYNKRFKK